MKLKFKAALGMMAAMGAFLLPGPFSVIAQVQDRSQAAFRAAMDKETIDGDVKGAIEQYKKIADGRDRGLAAQALLRMADAYRKLGDAESRKVYERIVQEFGDQREAVTAARAKLAGDGLPAGEFGQKLLWNARLNGYPGDITPDGRYLTFEDRAVEGLSVRDLVTGRNRVLATKIPVVDRSVISPDGSRVACECWGGAKPEIHVFELGSGVKERKFSFASGIRYVDPQDWSPDGTQIAVQIFRDDLGSVQIGLMNPDDGTLRVLESVDWRASTRIFFSPDGKYLAFDLPAADSNQRDVFVLATDGSRKADAVIDPAMDTVMGWAPDGGHLLFASDRTGSNSLWALPFLDGKPQGNAKVLKSNIGSSSLLGISRAGGLYYKIGPADAGIFVASADFESGTVLDAPVLATKDNVGGRQHRWSSDGKYLAYATAGVDKFNILSIVDVRTGQARRLPIRLDYFQFPVWTQNDQSVIVRGTDLKGAQGLFRINVETGEAVSLGGSGFPLALSADGEKIFLRLPNKIVERHLISGMERVVLEQNATSASISPDRRFYAYITTGDESKKLILRVVPFAGGESKEFSIRSGSWTAWSSDGRYILFGQGAEIWTIPAAGGDVRRFDLKWENEIFFPSVQPGGNKLAFASTVNAGLNQDEGIWVLQNFLPTTQTVK